MNVETKKTLSLSEKDQIHELWNQEYPVNLNNRFALLLDDATFVEHFLIKDLDQVLAWAVLFEKDEEKRFSIIVSPTRQGKGLGKQLIHALQRTHADFYGWVIDRDDFEKLDGSKYISPLAFYQKLNFQVLREQRIETELLSAVKIYYSGL